MPGETDHGGIRREHRTGAPAADPLPLHPQLLKWSRPEILRGHREREDLRQCAGHRRGAGGRRHDRRMDKRTRAKDREIGKYRRKLIAGGAVTEKGWQGRGGKWGALEAINRWRRGLPPKAMPGHREGGKP